MKSCMKNVNGVMAGLLLAIPVMADSPWNCYDRHGAEFSPCFYVGAGLGVSSFKPDVKKTGYDVDDKTDAGWMVYGGYQFDSNWFAEVAWLDMGDAGVKARNPALPSGTISYEVPSVMAGYVIDLDKLILDEVPVDLFIKAGAASIDNTASPSGIPWQQRNDLQLALGAGVDWRFASHWKMRAALESYDKDALFGYLGVAYIFGEGKVRPEPASVKKPEPEPEPEAQSAPPPVVQPAPVQPEASRQLCDLLGGALKDVRFKTASAELTDSTKVSLAEMAEILKHFPEVKLEVQAHTDNQGNDAYNLKLSDSRAKVVMDFFISQGVEADRLSSKGYGESMPIADNTTEAGRALNRRVELVSHTDQCPQR